MPLLEVIRLNGNKLGDGGDQCPIAFAEAILHLPRLRVVDLADNMLDPGGVVRLSQSFAQVASPQPSPAARRQPRRYSHKPPNTRTQAPIGRPPLTRSATFRGRPYDCHPWPLLFSPPARPLRP